jgi:phosphatidate cytidylyltransferase
MMQTNPADMLKDRVITAAVLIPLVVYAVLFSPGFLFAVILGLIFLVAANEWEHIARFKQLRSGLFTVLLGAGMLAGLLMTHRFSDIILSLSLLWWLFALLAILTYPRYFPAGHALYCAKMVAGLLILLPAYCAMLRLHQAYAQGPWLLLYLFIIIWAADTGAFFCGKNFGRHKLAPLVSPGKTWEGMLGGLLAGAFVAIIATRMLYLPALQSVLFVGLAVVAILVSVIGDLTISMFKRHVGLKDSGSLLPGHGGLLDRIDSLMSAMPIFALGLEWMRF